MELLLNLLWFLIASGALLLWLPRSSAHRRQFRQGLGALLCVLALLLPAISITDDLHFEAFAVEDSSSTKRLVSAAAHISPISSVVWFGISVLALFFGAFSQPIWGTLETAFEPHRDSCFPGSILGRAPPSVLA
jgi:hypothetical protein